MMSNRLERLLVIGIASLSACAGPIKSNATSTIDSTPTPPTAPVFLESIISLADIGCDKLFNALWSYLVHNTGTNTYQAYYPSGHSGAHGPVGLPNVERIVGKEKWISTNFEQPEEIIDYLDQHCPDYEVDYEPDGVRVTYTKSPYRPQNQNFNQEQSPPELWRDLVTALIIATGGSFVLRKAKNVFAT